MKANYYDPIFYICSDEMPFNIRICVAMKEEVSGESLERALALAIKRYPYFAIKVKKDGEEYIAFKNDAPIVAYRADRVYALGSEEVNGHLLAASYKENEINFFVSHIITDGCGFFPFIKTALYYYICDRHGVSLDSTGIELYDSPMYDDEVKNPYPEAEMAKAEALYEKKCGEYFRLCDGGYVKQDDKRKVYRFKVREKDMMAFSYDNDGSPCALISVLMAKAIWALHPEEKKSIVSAVSFNLRPGLKNRHSYRMLCSAIMLEYKNKMRDDDILKLCTCSRGMTTLQSQAENVLSYAEKRRKWAMGIGEMGTLEDKKRIIGKKALVDSVSNTFSVSYVGRMDFGAIKDYVDSIYVITDGSTYKTAFIEVMAFNGWFHISLLQGFESDAYLKALLEQFRENGMECFFEGGYDFGLPETVLP